MSLQKEVGVLHEERKNIKLFFKKIEAGKQLNRQQIQTTITRDVALGATLAGISLSAKSSRAVSKEMVNSLATKYVNENIISKEISLYLYFKKRIKIYFLVNLISKFKSLAVSWTLESSLISPFNIFLAKGL